jgi:hypothetical protein
LKRERTKIIDPTANVIALSQAANARQDDLRAANTALIECELRGLKSLVDSNINWLEKLMQLHSTHDRDIHKAEQDRLLSIRSIDVAAVQALSERTEVDSENLRKAVQNTATTLAEQTARLFDRVTDRIASLEKSAYEGQGKQAYTDPMMTKILASLETLKEGSATQSGSQKGASAMVAYIISGVMLLLAIASRFFPS